MFQMFSKFYKNSSLVKTCSFHSNKINQTFEPSLLLAKTWTEKMDPTGYWMSEKLDGIRALWNGSVFTSRLGNSFSAPDWFKEALPKHISLDGELWVGRDKFQKTVSIVKTFDNQNKNWKDLIYYIFDVPEMTVTFEERLNYLKEYYETVKEQPGGQYIRLVEHSKCQGLDHLKSTLKKIEDEKGEGIMLRKPGSLYVRSRSNTLLKVKTFQDMEAIIEEYEPGKGKYTGMTGSLVVKMRNGTKFSIGTGLKDNQRRNPPKIGQIITFKHQGFTEEGIPRFPIFVGERVDVK